MSDLRSNLESLGVVSLMTAARMAGLKFRNGELNKAEIINRLMNYPAMASAAWAVAQKSGSPVMVRPTPSMADWSDDEAPASAAERNGANSPELESLRGSIDSALRNIGGLRSDLDEVRSDYVTQNQARRIAGEAVTQAAPSIAETALRIVIEAAKQGKIPGIGETHIHFPPPVAPIKVSGITHPELPTVVGILRSGEQAFLVGPAGSGKTTAAKQVREILAADFGREDYECLAIGAVADSFALTGYKNAMGEYIVTLFRKAYEHGHLFLWDEVDASSPEATLVINALDNGFVSFPDAVVTAHPHFRIIAGGNTDGSGATMEYSGRSRLDGAFRDRFAIVQWNLDPRIEAHLSRGDSLWLECVRAVRAFAEKREIQDVVATARAVRRGPLFLHQGMTREKVLEVTCKRGALVECWADVLRLPAVIAFLRG